MILLFHRSAASEWQRRGRRTWPFGGASARNGSFNSGASSAEERAEEEQSAIAEIDQQRSAAHAQSPHGRLFLQGVQRMSVGHPLHGVVDPPGDPRPAHSHRRRRGTVHAQPQPATRRLRSFAFPSSHHLDGRRQRSSTPTAAID